MDIDIIKKLLQEKEQIIQRANKIDSALEILKELGISVNGANGHNLEHVEPIQREVFKAPIKKGGWNPKWKMRVKAKFLLIELGRFSHVNELRDLAESYGEPELEKGNTVILRRRLSAALVALKKKGEVDTLQLGTTSTSHVWGLKDWMEVPGKAKEEFKPDATLVEKFG